MSIRFYFGHFGRHKPPLRTLLSKPHGFARPAQQLRGISNAFKARNGTRAVATKASLSGLGLGVLAGLTVAALFSTSQADAKDETKEENEAPFYKLSAVDIDHQLVNFDQFRGKVVLVVNVASECGSTDMNYKQLQELYSKYHDQGLEILGFPCNQFGKQEPGTNEEIKKFATQKYGVQFRLFEKIDVNGSTAHPVFEYLSHVLPGALGTTSIKWNFTKFLVDRKGQPFRRYATATSPLSMEDDIKNLLRG